MTARVHHFVQQSRLACVNSISAEARVGSKLVNGFVNETPRNDGDGVERSVMA